VVKEVLQLFFGPARKSLFGQADQLFNVLQPGGVLTEVGGFQPANDSVFHLIGGVMSEGDSQNLIELVIPDFIREEELSKS